MRHDFTVVDKYCTAFAAYYHLADGWLVIMMTNGYGWLTNMKGKNFDMHPDEHQKFLDMAKIDMQEHNAKQGCPTLSVKSS